VPTFGRDGNADYFVVMGERKTVSGVITFKWILRIEDVWV